MNVEQREILLKRAKEFFRTEIVQTHIEKSCKKAGKLKEYNVNPFLFKYLANFLKGNDEPESIAEALILPRILGSSIATTFGMRIQDLISVLFEGLGSTTPGIDIEFIDSTDNRKKYCQLKAGPNTINYDDVTTIVNHFSDIRNRARTNNLRIELDDLIVGVIYGESSGLSSHYKKLNQTFPVYVGQEFWYRLTGITEFYYELIDAFGEVALEMDGQNVIKNTIKSLAEDIKRNYFK
ncbi:MAG: hypothetical protein SCALA702_30030 [Melioribacteraceae bacterium]|nr:MAG: hypothetical protein SCALA702_30030 [Melioribacteraceae bacterium]